MFLANEWKDYEVLDTGDGEKLERWGDVILRRPDPQTIWPKADPALWRQAQAHYHRSERGGGEWEFLQRLPEKWEITFRDLRFWVRPTGFKHTGLFPEQAANWAWMADLIKASGRKDVKVLNLFGYTGAATLACASAGAHVTHVDAAKGMVQWAKENAVASGLADKPIHWMVDDCAKFIQREIRRGRKYDGIIMDPPSYGRGPSGEIWKMETSFYPFLQEVVKVLSDDPLFVIINSYTTGLAPSAVAYAADVVFGEKHGGRTEAGELGLPVTESGLILPCGATGRWTP